MTPTEFKSRLSELSEKRSSISDKLKFSISEVRDTVRKYDDRILKWGCEKGYSFQDYNWSLDGIYFGDSVEYTFYQILGEDADEIYNKLDAYSLVEEEHYELDNDIEELEAEVLLELSEFVQSLERWEDPEVLLCFCSLFITDIPTNTGASIPVQDFITWWEKRNGTT